MKWYNQLVRCLMFAATCALAVQATANEVLTFDSDELRDRYTELTFQLRCPKCQNQNVADSNAPISEDIRLKTYEMLHQGYTDQEIIDFMIDRYTEFVTYKPQMSLVTIWLWVLPITCLVIGMLILIRLTKRSKQNENPALTEEESARLKALLEEKS